MPNHESFCEIHWCFFELFEGVDDDPDYYECPECERERAEALYDGSHYENAYLKKDQEPGESK